MSSTLTVQIWHDGDCAQEIPFVGEKLQIGRLHENDVVINHLSVSRTHAVLERVGDQIAVMDLGSQNGIWVDGERLSERMIVAPGSSLRIGQHELRICIEGEASPPAAAEVESVEGGTDAVEVSSDAVSSPAIEIDGAAPESMDDLLVPEADLASVAAAMPVEPMPEDDALADFEIDDGAVDETGVDVTAEGASAEPMLDADEWVQDTPMPSAGDDAAADALFDAEDDVTSLVDLVEEVPQAAEDASIDTDELFAGAGGLDPSRSLDAPGEAHEVESLASVDTDDLLSHHGPIEDEDGAAGDVSSGELPAAGMEITSDSFASSATEDGVPSLDHLPELGAPLEEIEPIDEGSESPREAATSEPLYPGLIVQRSGELDQLVPWDQPELCAGRGSDCELLLGEPEVSRRHALFLRSGDAYEVRDLGSINGVYVNDTKVEAKTLEPGDLVRIESFELTFVMERHPIGSDVHEPQTASSEISPEQEQRHLTVIGEMPPMGGEAMVGSGTMESSPAELPALDLVEEAFDEVDPDAKDEAGQPLRLELEVSLDQLPEALRKALCELGDATLELPVRLKVRS